MMPIPRHDADAKMSIPDDDKMSIPDDDKMSIPRKDFDADSQPDEMMSIPIQTRRF